MKIIHTSDWHLGRSLFGKKRHEEFEAFLNWLGETIIQTQATVLLIAGDIFDTTTPGNRAQALYYRFLCQVVAGGSCKHVVVTAGNHDSPSFLEAPRELLKSLQVHVVGATTENLQDEVLTLTNPDGQAELIVCAVPYLRDRDMRLVEPGESFEDKERKLTEGIRRHYSEVVTIAEVRRKALGVDIPIVALGHLFTTGGTVQEGDGVRDLYVGSLARVTADTFPASIDYLALGHLHIPQKVHGSETRRYSGSPLALSFGEAKQKKSICLVSFCGSKAKAELLEVPSFQNLERIEGDLEAIKSRLLELANQKTSTWLEIIYTGAELQSNLRSQIEEIIGESSLEILRLKNARIINQLTGQIMTETTLEELTPDEVFAKCLLAHQVTEADQQDMWLLYQETLASLAALNQD